MKMQAMTFHEHGGIEQLCLEEVDRPHRRPQELLIRVKACALNHLDLWVRQGIPAYRPSLPHILGSDIAGIIEESGEVEGPPVGTRVVVFPGLTCRMCEWCYAGRENLCQRIRIVGAHVNGGYAQFVTVPASNVIPLPEGLSFEEGAAFPLVSVTAWHMLVSLACLQPSEDVLVIGAGSGVGSLAVQIGKLIGARVIATVGSDAKRQKALALGADHVVEHSEGDLAKRVQDLTGGRGVDVVFEHVGAQIWEQCLASLAKGGRLVTCGATTGPEARLVLRQLFSRQLTIKGSYLGTRVELMKVSALMARGKLQPVIDHVLPLAEARHAHELLLERKVFGKVVLSVP